MSKNISLSLSLLSLCLSLGFSLHTQAEGCPVVSSKMRALINEQATTLRGIENCEYRYIYKELNVELVLFTVSGACLENSEATAGSCGNTDTVYIGGVINDKPYAPVAASKDSSFSPNKVKMVDNEIVLTGLTHAKTDPLCCPSLKKTLRLKITEAGFQE